MPVILAKVKKIKKKRIFKQIRRNAKNIPYFCVDIFEKIINDFIR